MLVLTRKQQQAIRISDNIRIVITRTGSNCVQIGIEAPANVFIEREELWAIRQEFSEINVPTPRTFLPEGSSLPSHVIGDDNQ